MGYNGLFLEMEEKVCVGSFYRRVKLEIMNIIFDYKSFSLKKGNCLFP